MANIPLTSVQQIVRRTCWAAIRSPGGSILLPAPSSSWEEASSRSATNQILCLSKDSVLLTLDEAKGRSTCWLWKRKQRITENEWQSEWLQQHQAFVSPTDSHLSSLSLHSVGEWLAAMSIAENTTPHRRLPIDLCGRVTAISACHRIRDQCFFFINMTDASTRRRQSTTTTTNEMLPVIFRSDSSDCPLLWLSYGLRVGAVLIIRGLQLKRLFPGRAGRERLLLCADADNTCIQLIKQEDHEEEAVKDGVPVNLPSQIISTDFSQHSDETTIMLDENSVENYFPASQREFAAAYSQATGITGSQGSACSAADNNLISYQGRVTRIIDINQSLIEMDGGRVRCYLLHQPAIMWNTLLGTIRNGQNSWTVRLVNVHWVFAEQTDGTRTVELVCCFYSSFQLVQFHPSVASIDSDCNSQQYVVDRSALSQNRISALAAQDHILIGQAFSVLAQLLSSSSLDDRLSESSASSRGGLKAAQDRLVESICRHQPLQSIDVFKEFFSHKTNCHLTRQSKDAFVIKKRIWSVESLASLIDATQFQPCLKSLNSDQREDFSLDYIQLRNILSNGNNSTAETTWLLARLDFDPTDGQMMLCGADGRNCGLAVCGFDIMAFCERSTNPFGVYLFRISDGDPLLVGCEQLALPASLNAASVVRMERSIFLQLPPNHSEVTELICRKTFGAATTMSESTADLLLFIRSINKLSPNLLGTFSAAESTIMINHYASIIVGHKFCGRRIIASVAKILKYNHSDQVNTTVEASDRNIFQLKRTDYQLEMEIFGQRALQFTAGLQTGRWFLFRGRFDIRSLDGSAQSCFYHCKIGSDSQIDAGNDSDEHDGNRQRISELISVAPVRFAPRSEFTDSENSHPDPGTILVDDQSWQQVCLHTIRGFNASNRLYSVRELLSPFTIQQATNESDNRNSLHELSSGYLSQLISFTGVIVAKRLISDNQNWLPIMVSGRPDEYMLTNNSWSIKIPVGKIVVFEISSVQNSRSVAAAIIELYCMQSQCYPVGLVPGVAITVERALIKHNRHQQHERRLVALQSCFTTLTIGDRLPSERFHMQQEQHQDGSVGMNNESLRESVRSVRDSYLCDMIPIAPVIGKDERKSTVLPRSHRIILDVLFIEHFAVKWLCSKCRAVIGGGGKCSKVGCAVAQSPDKSHPPLFTAELVCHVTDPTGEAVLKMLQIDPEEVFECLRFPSGAREQLRNLSLNDGELIYVERAPWEQFNTAQTMIRTMNPNNSNSLDYSLDEDDSILAIQASGDSSANTIENQSSTPSLIDRLVCKYFPSNKARTMRVVCRLAEEFGRGGWYNMAEYLRPFADQLGDIAYCERTFRVNGVELKTLCPPRLVIVAVKVERLDFHAIAETIWQRVN